ncbi:MAG: AAA family ATPase [Candidatus Thermoplasmatota archaeon]|nr:AAA family ATPase [Candidatus Thermoplasmatota archaeon]
MDETVNVQVNKANVTRLKTGIMGLDDLIEGGIPKGSFVVVAGGPGSGKSIMGMQAIAAAVQRHEKAIFISAEQMHDELIEQAWQFGWDFAAWEKEGLLRIVSLNSQDLFEGNKIKELKDHIQADQYAVGVIDSISSISNQPVTVSNLIDGARSGIQTHTFYEINRTTVITLIDMFKQKGITTYGLAQKTEGMPGETMDMLSEFKADGLITLDAVEIGGSLNRTIRVKKLRKTNIDGLTYTFEFTPTGIVMKYKEV